MTQIRHPIDLRPLSAEDGGGWFAEIHALPGCASDGETPEEALRNLEDAHQAWQEAAAERGPVTAVEPARDVLGQPIGVGDLVLWGRHGGKSGFASDRPMRVRKLGPARASLATPEGHRKTVAVPYSALVVVTRLVTEVRHAAK